MADVAQVVRGHSRGESYTDTFLTVEEDGRDLDVEASGFLQRPVVVLNSLPNVVIIKKTIPGEG